ncbi:MAG: hypothetical protein AAGK32_10050 [Actinomycetota bacterium]
MSQDTDQPVDHETAETDGRAAMAIIILAIVLIAVVIVTLV